MIKGIFWAALLWGAFSFFPEREIQAQDAPFQPEEMFQVTDPELAERTSYLESRSASFARALQNLREGSIPVVVLTDKEMAHRFPAHYAMVSTSQLAGGTLWFRNNKGEPTHAMVVVKVRYMEDLHNKGGRSRIRRVIDQILIHELYGHVAPVAEGLVRTCADPTNKNDVMDACVTKRENVVRKEMRLPLTRVYH